MPEIIGDYEYSKGDIIGHGAFAIVFLGHSRTVISVVRIDREALPYLLDLDPRATSGNQTDH